MERETLYAGRWFSLKTLPIELESGKKTVWEYMERTNHNNFGDGVEVIATIGNKLICVAEYRYPVSGYVLEFPAGLSEGLEPADCAIKELKEETGYTAGKENIQYISPVVNIDPWKSTETTVFVGITVPETEENKNPVQELEDEEIITVELIDMNDLLGGIDELVQRKGYKISAKLYLFAKGIHDSRKGQ